MSDGYVLRCGKSTVAIDYWTALHASAFFLTHMHADHYKGLHNEWCQGTIYCSEITGMLLQRKWPSLSAKTIALDETVTLQLSDSDRFTVTAIDANHCPVRKATSVSAAGLLSVMLASHDHSLTDAARVSRRAQ